MELELRHARIVSTIAETGSISRAAGWLNLPQPSLTTQLRRIEKMLGGDLFVRSRAGVVPTSLGNVLIPMMTRLVEQADEVRGAAATYAESTLRFGNTEWTPPTLLGAIRDAVPSADVETETLAPAAAVEAIRRGSLTVAMIACSKTVTPELVQQPELDSTVIVQEPILLAVSMRHSLAGRPFVETAQLADLDWVRYSGNHWFHEVERHVLAQLGQGELKALHYVDGYQEAMSWVKDANAVALTPPTGATREVKLVPIREPHSIEMMLVWRRGAVAKDTLHRLVEAVRRYHYKYVRTLSGYWRWIKEYPVVNEPGRFLPVPSPAA
ncbi:LysR family transcriptional regulator [Streptomyces sp. NPDC049099]|uniref:LysR family transcriptional regulator n=1 Tax=Streptomyces sp. NPDC049099 TaxID=3155768 RepID=UPI00341878DC